MWQSEDGDGGEREDTEQGQFREAEGANAQVKGFYCPKKNVFFIIEEP